MKNLDDPPRMLDATGLPSDVRAVIRSATADSPTEAQLAMVAARLGFGAIASSAVVSASTGRSVAKIASTATRLALMKKIVAMATIVIAGGASMVAWRVSRQSHVHAAPLRSDHENRLHFATPAVLSPVPEVASRATEVPTPTLERVVLPARNVGSTSRPNDASHRTLVPNGNHPPSEMEILDAASAAMQHGEPLRALSLTAQHASAYPSGALAEERERIAIEALLRAGRANEARTRATRFRTRYPSSTYAPRIDVLLTARDGGQ